MIWFSSEQPPLRLNGWHTSCDSSFWWLWSSCCPSFCILQPYQNCPPPEKTAPNSMRYQRWVCPLGLMWRTFHLILETSMKSNTCFLLCGNLPKVFPVNVNMFFADMNLFLWHHNMNLALRFYYWYICHLLFLDSSPPFPDCPQFW